MGVAINPCGFFMVEFLFYIYLPGKIWISKGFGFIISLWMNLFTAKKFKAVSQLSLANVWYFVPHHMVSGWCNFLISNWISSYQKFLLTSPALTHDFCPTWIMQWKNCWLHESTEIKWNGDGGWKKIVDGAEYFKTSFPHLPMRVKGVFWPTIDKGCNWNIHQTSSVKISMKILTCNMNNSLILQSSCWEPGISGSARQFSTIIFGNNPQWQNAACKITILFVREEK